MRKFRTLDEFAEQYFCDRPEEIDDYLAEIFQEFAEDNDTGVLLASLRVIARVQGYQGISDIAEQIDIITARSLISIKPLELMTRKSVFQVLPNLRSRANS